MSLMPPDLKRRRRAKRFNEQLKLVATLGNNLAIGTLVGALLLPLATDRSLSPNVFKIWIPVAIGIHLLSQLLLGLFYQSED